MLQIERAKAKKESGLFSSADLIYSCKERMSGIQLTKSRHRHYRRLTLGWTPSTAPFIVNGDAGWDSDS